MYSIIGLGIAAGLIGLGVLAIIVAGARSLKNGKVDFKKIVTFLVPFAVYGVAFGITGSFNEAGIATMIFMIGAMILFIVLTGFRSTFNL
ncbi:MAG: hypothetical protein ACNS64_04520 [Candidatus Halalkalibacterium sp. M3_1C_030]